MLVLEIIAAVVITLSLAAMVNADTRDTRVRVTHWSHGGSDND